MEFHVPYLKMLKEMGWETAVAARNDYEDPDECSIPYCDQYYDVPFERNPLKPGNLKAYSLLKKIIDRGKYDIIHCHTPVGGLLTRLAAGKVRKNGTKVFYTAHGFHFYTGAPLINWLAYYPVERFLAHKTDVLITINSEDYRRAKSFKAGKVVYVPGIGVDIAKFKQENCDPEKIKMELGLNQDDFVILSVGEVNKNKNHRIIIEALPSFPDYYFVLCGQGPLMDELKEKASRLGVGNRVIIAGYQKDVAKFYQMADLFVFPSLREGLPVALMEAMSADLLCVAAQNRGTNDLLPDSKLKFEAKNLNDLIDKLYMVEKSDCTEEIRKNRETIKKFDLKNSLSLVKDLYLSFPKYHVL